MRSQSAPRLLVFLIVVALGQALHAGQGSDVLVNEDVVKMVRAQLSTTVILNTIQSANAKFDVSPTALVALKEAGVEDRIIEAMQVKARAAGAKTELTAPEKSDLLADAKDRETILRSFKTVFVDASHAVYFGNPQMKAALGRNKDWSAMQIAVVDDRSLADTVLEVGYTFAWDYPFSLKHQNTSVVLVSGKGSGPFSGPRGATSVAGELVKLLKPYRRTGQPGRAK